MQTCSCLAVGGQEMASLLAVDVQALVVSFLPDVISCCSNLSSHTSLAIRLPRCTYCNMPSSHYCNSVLAKQCQKDHISDPGAFHIPSCITCMLTSIMYMSARSRPVSIECFVIHADQWSSTANSAQEGCAMPAALAQEGWPRKRHAGTRCLVCQAGKPQSLVLDTSKFKCSAMQLWSWCYQCDAVRAVLPPAIEHFPC